MVGLPARGKTVLSHKLNRYLNWNGLKSKGKFVKIGSSSHISIYKWMIKFTYILSYLLFCILNKCTNMTVVRYIQIKIQLILKTNYRIFSKQTFRIWKTLVHQRNKNGFNSLKANIRLIGCRGVWANRTSVQLIRCFLQIFLKCDIIIFFLRIQQSYSEPD